MRMRRTPVCGGRKRGAGINSLVTQAAREEVDLAKMQEQQQQRKGSST